MQLDRNHKEESSPLLQSSFRRPEREEQASVQQCWEHCCGERKLGREEVICIRSLKPENRKDRQVTSQEKRYYLMKLLLPIW